KAGTQSIDRCGSRQSPRVSLASLHAAVVERRAQPPPVLGRAGAMTTVAGMAQGAATDRASGELRLRCFAPEQGVERQRVTVAAPPLSNGRAAKVVDRVVRDGDVFAEQGTAATRGGRLVQVHVSDDGC